MRSITYNEKPMISQTTIIHIWCSQACFFFLNDEALSTSQDSHQITFTSRTFSTMSVNRTRSNHRHHHKIKVAYCTSNHRLANGIGWWSAIPFLEVRKLCHFLLLQCSWKRGTLCVGVHLYTFIRDRFHSLFWVAVLGNLKFFFQVDRQVDIYI